ncbi:hypothetical protein [Streptomyces sp. NPDC047981]|uniref:hypothetical protein n=1 Tax=Streptomyces sp. NPDC047981 TaxID=3154610 RepID=UPI00342100A7
MTAYQEADEETDSTARPRRTRRPLRLAIGALVLAVLAGGGVWVFQDELFRPFGDARACEGTEAALPEVIAPGGTPLPDDASEVHYAVRKGRAQVSFLSDRIPEYLVRAGMLTPGEPLIDERKDPKYALGDGEAELPTGLCGSPLYGPVWFYGDGDGSVGVEVERSPVTRDRFPSPARAVVTYSVR